MTLDAWYWLFLVLWIVLGLWLGYTPGQPYNLHRAGWNLFAVILFVLIGLRVFGHPVK